MRQGSDARLWLLAVLSMGIGAQGACRPHAHQAAREATPEPWPHRASEEAGLAYAARHFAELYPGAGPDVLVPVRPTLGLPALQTPGSSVEVHYLVRSTPARAEALGRELRLELRLRAGPASSPPADAGDRRGVSLARGSAAASALTDGIVHLRVRATLPGRVALGLYDLLHRRPAWQARSEAAVGIREPSRPGSPLVFVHLTDLHQGERPDPRLAKTLDWIARLEPRPAFAVITGDLVEFGPDGRQWAAVRQMLERLPLPVFVTLGNHDYYRAGCRLEAALKGGCREELGLRHYLRTFHPFPAFRFDAEGYRFVAVDTGPCVTLRTLWHGQWIMTEGLGPRQLEDLSHFLASPAPRGHVLLAHAPPRARLNPRSDGCDPGLHGAFLQLRHEFEALLLGSWRRRPRPLVVLHGHLHWNDLYGRSPRPRCGLEVVPEAQPVMGTRPCWRALPVARSPLLVGTQSATKSNPLRSGGVLDQKRRYGEGASAARGFRLLRITGERWETALYRLYKRTPVAHRAHPEGFLPPGSERHESLPGCAQATPAPPRVKSHPTAR